MVNKLRDVMGKRDDKYTLEGAIELDAFFSTEIPLEENEEPLKRGRGSQKKTKVLVMAESKTVENPKPGKKPKNVLPWVHTAISNAKRQLLGVYYKVKPEYLQYYLNQFCYKFNRRYFGENQFDRLLIAAVPYAPDFKSRIYNRNYCG